MLEGTVFVNMSVSMFFVNFPYTYSLPSTPLMAPVQYLLGKTHACVYVRKGVTLLNTIHIHNGVQMRGLVTKAEV